MEHSESAYDRININYDEYPVCFFIKKIFRRNPKTIVFLSWSIELRIILFILLINDGNVMNK